jgi:hypothetical protein
MFRDEVAVGIARRQIHVAPGCVGCDAIEEEIQLTRNIGARGGDAIGRQGADGHGAEACRYVVIDEAVVEQVHQHGAH